MAQQFLVGLGPLVIQASRSHSETPHSVGLLWTSDQPDTETPPVYSQCSQETYTRAPGGIRTHNRSKQAAADSRD
jgi:hypothetical protein